MESLPPELFDNIFEYITDIPDLLSLRAVNKFFNSRFTPPAFASMTLVNNRTVLERAVNIVSSPLARWVTDLCIKFCRAESDDLGPSGYQAMNLASLTNIEAINFHFPSSYSNPDYRRRVIATALKALAHSGLTLLELEMKFFTCDCEHDITPGFERILGSLELLLVDIDCCPTFLETMLRPAQANLLSLFLTSRSVSCPFPIGLHFDRLHDLVLDFSTFEVPEPDSVETFILSLAMTLDTLTLNECVCTLDQVDGRVWAQVFKSFQVGLGCLKCFQISTIGYECGSNSQPTETQRAADIRALDELWQTIGQRDRTLPKGYQFHDMWIRTGYIEDTHNGRDADIEYVPGPPDRSGEITALEAMLGGLGGDE